LAFRAAERAAKALVEESIPLAAVRAGADEPATIHLVGGRVHGRVHNLIFSPGDGNAKCPRAFAERAFLVDYLWRQLELYRDNRRTETDEELGCESRPAFLCERAQCPRSRRTAPR
jgi:hypothetical protein